MPARASAALVEHHLGLMESTEISDSPSARLALGHAMAAVGAINLQLGSAPQAGMPFADPVDDVVAHLESWTSRLVNKLTPIARQLGAGFSITVGTAITVTISFAPLGEASQQ